MNTSHTNDILNTYIDFSTTFIVPVICSYGITTNIINFVIFCKNELTDITFKYYRVNAVSNIIYLTICFFLFAARCGIYCSFTKTLSSQVYLFFFYTYFKGIFAIMTICIQIVVSTYRLLIVINRRIESFKSYKMILIIIFVFSTLFYSPLLFTKTIKETITNATTVVNGTKTYIKLYTYSNVNNDIGNSNFGKWLIIFVVTIMRSFVALAVILTLGVVTLVKLNQHISNTKKIRGTIMSLNDFSSTRISDDLTGQKPTKKEAQNKSQIRNEKRSRNLSLMVASIGILFSVGNIPNCVVYVFQQYVDTNGIFYRTFSITANLFIFLVQGSDIVIYYFFNNQYRRAFKTLLVFRCIQNIKLLK